jgi:pilus assembly protein CpaE
MARLAGVVVTDDEGFRTHVAALLRQSPVPISIGSDSTMRDGARADIVIVDTRGDLDGSMRRAERWRAASPAGVFAVAEHGTPDVILQAMQAGANEFFVWPPPETPFHEAVKRAAARVQASAAAPKATTIVFFGTKGGAGTTTLAVNCGVELARLSQRPTIILDLKAGLGEVGLFCGIRSRYSLLDALDNLHRLDAEFLRELVVKHKSGLDILTGSDQWERPGASDGPGLEEVFRLLSNEYEYVLVDAGSQINASSIAALYTADTICLVANPDVPSVRNAQRLLDRIRQLGACDERVRLLLNRAAEPFPIPASNIEAAAGHPIDHTFPSDYKVVSAALNSGVPLALTGNTELAAQFDRFTRRILDPDADLAEAAPGKRSISLNRIASIW